MHLILWLLFVLPVYAIEVEYFEFSNSKTYNLIDDALLEESVVNNNYPWMLTAAADYVKVPLSIQTNSKRTADIVKSLTGLHLGGGYRISNRFFLGARTYLANIDSEDDGVFWGDSVLEAKWRFYQNNKTAIAFAPSIYLPTGTQFFATNGNKVGEYLGFTLEKNFDWVQISLMLGYSHRPGAKFAYGTEYSELNYTDAIYTGIGSIFPLTDIWALNLEGYRYNQFKGNQHPNEWYVGLRNQTTSSITSFFGISIGGLIDNTSNDFRVSAGIKFSPVEDKAKEIEKVFPQPTRVAKKISKREAGIQKEKRLYGEMVASETIYFSNGSSVVDDFSKDVVKKLNALTGKMRFKYTMVLEGFSSKVGNPKSNMQLSFKRIDKTKEILADLGVNTSSIVTVAYGDSVADTSVNEALNRKVMIRLYRK
jgi:outer membrane protein OmpA-like peptidoglycan-associated protein